jgi:hypothetical protein
MAWKLLAVITAAARNNHHDSVSLLLMFVVLLFVGAGSSATSSTSATIVSPAQYYDVIDSPSLEMSQSVSNESCSNKMSSSSSSSGSVVVDKQSHDYDDNNIIMSCSNPTMMYDDQQQQQQQQQQQRQRQHPQQHPKSKLFTREQHESFGRDGFVIVSNNMLGGAMLNELVNASNDFLLESNKMKSYFTAVELGMIFQASKSNNTNNNNITRAFRNVALHSVLPRAAAELMQLDPSNERVRVIRYVF